MAKKVFVGMSGGVDSSVAAALLIGEGYDVTGVYMKNWTEPVGGYQCAWQQDYQDALAVAVGLGIDLKVYDFQTEYRQQVVDYMIREYQVGHTPNPDIMCNQEIKFKLFLATALNDGADMIATGHYARVKSTQTNAELLQAKDTNKDQTYFLYRITKEALRKTLFPVGKLTKPEVRSLAKKLKLPTAKKPDSQGICFIGEVGIKDFLKNYVVTKPGPIIDTIGTIIGQHDGAIFYTIGQRHGLDVGGGLPYYVTGKDITKNEVYVTNNIDDPGLWKQSITLSDLHWINKIPRLNHTYQLRTRHRAPLVPGTLQVASKTIQTNSKTLQVVFDNPVRAITPGQSVVVYDGENVLGGGIVT